MKSIEFRKTPTGFRYLDLEDFKQKNFEEVQEMLIGRKQICDRENIDTSEMTLPIVVSILFEDFTAMRGVFFPHDEREKTLALQAVKQVVLTSDYKHPVTHVLVVMEAWIGIYKVTDEDKEKYTEEELERKARKQFRKDKEKDSGVIFNLLSPVTVVDSQTNQRVQTTHAEVTVYKLLDETYMELHTDTSEDPDIVEISPNKHFMFFNPPTEDEKEAKETHGFKIFNAFDAIEQIRATLQSINSSGGQKSSINLKF